MRRHRASTRAPFTRPPGPVVSSVAGHVIGHHRPVVEGGRPEQVEGQPGVVGPGIPVEEAGHQLVGPERGHVGQGLFPGDPLVAAADAHAAGEVVEPQGGAVDPGHAPVDHPVPAEERDEEGERGDQVGRVVEEPLALGQVLVDQAVLVLLQVAEPAVDHLGRLGGGARGEVVALDQGGPQAPAGGVEGHAGPGDPPADHQHVERLGGQAFESLVPVEPSRRGRVGRAGGVLHGPSLPHAVVGPSARRPSGGRDPRRVPTPVTVRRALVYNDC